MRLSKTIKYFLLMAMSFSLFVSSGIIAKAAGWKYSKGNWHYEDSDGKNVKAKWIYDGAWFYFDKKGNMVTGLQVIDNKEYYFAPETKGQWKVGRMMYGWMHINGSYKYFTMNGESLDEAADVSSTIKGIDVSQYQGDMDWHKVAGEGIKFTFIRVGHGDHNIDPYYKQNMKAANAAGIKTGVYFYSTAKSEAASRSDAQWVIRQMQGYKVNYPVALDLEDSSQVPYGRDHITKMAKIFCDEIKAAGYTPMVYCNENWAKNYIDFTKLRGVYKWIARYNGTFDETITRDIWQAGSTTLLDGIDVNSVDIDFAYKDFTTIVKERTKYKSGYTYKTNSNSSKTSLGWQFNSKGWWYVLSNGTYVKNAWYKIGKSKYHFNKSGYMQTGWIKVNGKYYYLGTDGVMVSNIWVQKNGRWHYQKKDGSSAVGWTKINGKWRYFTKYGNLKTGWTKLKKKWYYLGTDGVRYQNQWLKHGNKWYFFNKKGIMVTKSLKKINKKTYYFNKKGIMQTGWVRINGKKYYFYGDGHMAKNTTIDGKKLGKDGTIKKEE